MNSKAEIILPQVHPDNSFSIGILFILTFSSSFIVYSRQKYVHYSHSVDALSKEQMAESKWNFSPIYVFFTKNLNEKARKQTGERNAQRIFELNSFVYSTWQFLKIPCFFFFSFKEIDIFCFVSLLSSIGQLLRLNSSTSYALLFTFFS